MSAHKRSQHARHQGHGARYVLGVTFSLVVLSILANVCMAAVYHNRALPNTYLGHLNVSGKSLHILPATPIDAILPHTFTFAHNNTKTARTLSSLGLSITIPTSSLSDHLGHLVPLISLIRHRKIPFHLAFTSATYRNATVSLSHIFLEPALPQRIVLNNTSFSIAPSKTGYQLDANALAGVLTTSALSGRPFVNVPVTPITATSSDLNLTTELTNLQKQLATKITFAYQMHRNEPSTTDVSRWFIPSGQSMVLSPDAISAYITKTGHQFGITVANPDSLVTGVTYALSKNLPLTFVLVPSAGDTVIRTYCIAIRNVSDAILNELAGKLAATYNDTRGWNDNGHIAFEQVPSGCQYTVWMSAAAQMTSFGAICDDYYNCQVGTNVILNYDRWTTGTTPWNATHGSLESYRTLMINHETGHRLGFLDNPTCPGLGQSAPVMMQQSINLKGCTFNIWPLSTEFTQLNSMLSLPATVPITSD